VYLVANFSCTSGNLIFSGFSYAGSANPSNIVIPASGINVSPIVTTGDEGFKFSAGWLVGNLTPGISSFQYSLIQYVVTDIEGITDIELNFNAQPSGTGAAGVTENFCLGAATVVGCPANKSGQVAVTDPPLKLGNSIVFSPVTSIAISKDISLASGINGTARLVQLTDQYSQIVPEPLSLSLAGLGLIGLGLVRRRLVYR
jgi:hypothetical protein